MSRPFSVTPPLMPPLEEFSLAEKRQRMRTSEKWMIATICAILVIVFSNFFYRTTALKHLDSVFLFEATQSILSEGRPVSKTVSSWPDVLLTFSMPAETLCQSNLEQKSTGAYNVLDNHAYVALYLIAPLTALLSPELTFAFLNALAHILLIVFPFCFLRKNGIRPAASLVFSLCIALYPAWALSAAGDYYLDRLYMPFALLSLYAMHALICNAQEKKNGKLLIAYAASTVVAMLFTERAAIMMAAQIAFFLLFFPQARIVRSIRNTAAVLFLFSAVYLFLYFRFFHQGIEEGGDIFGSLLETLHNPGPRLKAPGIPAFIVVNLLFVGIFICFSGYRYILLALGALLPNLLISIGGAELTGWSTHYHTMYIPFLIFAASVGYSQWLNSLESEQLHRRAVISTCGYIVVIAGLLNPYTGTLLGHFNGFQEKNISRKIFNYYVRPNKSDERSRAIVTESLASQIPQGVKVSAVEDMMPVLYHSRSLTYFPLNLYSSDYAIVSGIIDKNGGKVMSGAVNYRGPEQAAELNRCLLQQMTEKGFYLLKAEPSIKMLVFKRGP